jgi:saccharopine dehydrogenase-like NADP-dependent oxidoreductase
MKKKVIVLGAGLVGRPIALDLATDPGFEVSIADISAERLNTLEQKGIKTIQADLGSETKLSEILNGFDFAVNATPGFMGFKTLETCIKAGTDTIDIAFYPENPEGLNDLALKNDVRVICDIGVAPGMSNLLTGYASAQLETVETVKIFVGGLPKARTLPWEYKAVFSPTDVIEEYTRPARVIENGEIVTKEPLTEIEHLEFEKTGTLEAFNSDGLRSLLWTIKAKNMYEKTLRYPGYASKIKFLADNGFLNNNIQTVGNQNISPLELSSSLLFKQWILEEGEVDLTVMRIIVEGKTKEKNLRYSYELYDELDMETGIHSMARTTGYTASVALRMLNTGLFTKKGICFPEALGAKKEIVDFFLKGLEARNITYSGKIEEL